MSCINIFLFGICKCGADGFGNGNLEVFGNENEQVGKYFLL